MKKVMGSLLLIQLKHFPGTQISWNSLIQERYVWEHKFPAVCQIVCGVRNVLRFMYDLKRNVMVYKLLTLFSIQSFEKGGRRVT